MTKSLRNRMPLPASMTTSLWFVVTVSLLGVISTAEAAAGQLHPSTDRIIHVDVINPPGGVGQTGVRSLGFVVGSELVVAKLPWDPGEFSNVPGFYSVVLGSEVFRSSILMAYDEITGLALLNVPGVTAPPYRFARDPDPMLVGERLAGVTGYVTPDALSQPGQENYLLDSLVTVFGEVTSADSRSVSHDAFTALHVAAGGPLFNSCGEVIGVTFTVAEGGAQGIPGAVLSSLFDADWEPIQAEAACGDAAEVGQDNTQRADSLMEVAQAYRDSVNALRNRVATLRNSAEEATLVLADSLETLANAFDQRAMETESELGALRAEMERSRAAYRQRVAIAIGISIIALIFVILGYRAARRSRKEADRSESAAAQAQSEAASRRAKERFASQFPSIFVEGRDDKGRSVAIQIPGRTIAASNGAVVGRSPLNSTTVIDHDAVSRQHFRLSARGKSVQIEDLNSTNGTRVNGTRLIPGRAVPLDSGAKLEIGNLKMSVSYQRSNPST